MSESFTVQQIADFIAHPSKLRHAVRTGLGDDGMCRARALRRLADEYEEVAAEIVSRGPLFGRRRTWSVEINGNAADVARIVLAFERAIPTQETS